MDTRTCHKCGETKSVSMFSNIPYNYRCRKCAAEHAKKTYRSKNRNRQVSFSEYQKIQKDKKKAARILAKAIKDGDIPKASSLICRCGNSAYGYHHYDGYEEGKELTVVPLCRVCHGKEHRGKSLIIV